MRDSLRLTVITLLLAASSLSAATHYVSTVSANPTPPYTNWATTATNIQAALSVAATNDVVLVTNGVYPGHVSVTNALALLSVNGPQFTVIDGGGTVQCIGLTDGASLSGFTLTNGVAYGGDGGGVSCTSTNAFITNCVIAGNSAVCEPWAGGGNGGGASYGTLYNCTLSGNSAVLGSSGGCGGGAWGCTLYSCTLSGNSTVPNAYGNANPGGGAYGCTLYNCMLCGNRSGSGAGGGGAYNCTLTGNSADTTGGGTRFCLLYNCIVYYNNNTGSNWANYDSSSTLNYCCTTPLPTNGAGNIALDPQLASASHLSFDSPCRRAGSAAYATGTDIDGELWANPPSMGCDEYHAGAVTGPLTVSIVADYTRTPVGHPVNFIALIEGRITLSVWDFGNGMVVSNRPYANLSWAAPGDYEVMLQAYNESHPAGVSATLTIHVVAQPPVVYVAATSRNPQPPYASWSTAATNIQQAVGMAAAGGIVVVTNGMYAGGVAVDKPLALLSVNGPQFTVINGGGTTPCASLTNGASLTGFTLTNGYKYSVNGGGVWCASGLAFLTNCAIVGNVAADGNGGGASGCTLYNCTLSGNGAGGYGGGALGCTLYNCTLTGNTAVNGGGASGCWLYNCRLTANLVNFPGFYTAQAGGGAYDCWLYNCVLYGNSV